MDVLCPNGGAPCPPVSRDWRLATGDCEKESLPWPS